MTRTLLRSLAGIVGEPHVLTGDATAGYAVDWTGRFRGETPAVVRPRDVPIDRGRDRCNDFGHTAGSFLPDRVLQGRTLSGDPMISVGRRSLMDDTDDSVEERP